MNIESIVISKPKTKLNNDPIYFGLASKFPKGDFLGVCEEDIICISKKCNLQILYTPIGIFATGINRDGLYVFISSVGYNVDEKPTLQLGGKTYLVNDIYHEMGLKRPLEVEA